MEYKDKFKDKLNKVWKDTIKETQPYRFDQTISKAGSVDTSKSRSFQIGKKLVVDEEMHFKHAIRIKEAIAQSKFSSERGNSVRGVKNNHIELMKIDNGGFIRVPKPNSRLRLNCIVNQYDDVK